MTPNEFCFWLHGAIELTQNNIQPTLFVFQQIRFHLTLVELTNEKSLTCLFVRDLNSILQFCNYQRFCYIWEKIVENLELCFTKTYGEKND